MHFIPSFMVYTSVYQQHETGHGALQAFCIFRNLTLSWGQIDRCVALDIHTHLALRLKKNRVRLLFILWILMTCSNVPVYDIFNSSFHFESLHVMNIFFMVRTTLDKDEYRACAE